MSNVGTVQTLVAIRAAQAEAARLEALTEAERKHAAEQEELQSVEARGAALDMWSEALLSRLSHPAFVRIASDWLLEKERELSQARLDRAIAERRQDQAQNEAGSARAKLLAITSLCDDLTRHDASRRAEKQMSELMDLVLARAAT